MRTTKVQICICEQQILQINQRSVQTDQDLFYSLNYSTITKSYLYNFDPLKPQFYIVHVKLGFTVVYIICLISAQKL